jgi:hypothetical protein
VSTIDSAGVRRKPLHADTYGSAPESFAISAQRFTELTAKIKAHIAKGDQAASKSEQHYIAAGQYLKELKADHKGDWAGWELTLKVKIGIGKSRASELMQIADGRKTTEQVRAFTAERVRSHEARKKDSPLANGETAKPLSKIEDESETAESELDEDPQNYKTAFLLRADAAIQFAVYTGPIVTMDMIECARTAAAKWDSLARSMVEAFAQEHPRRVIPAPEQQPPGDGIPDFLRRVAR